MNEKWSWKREGSLVAIYCQERIFNTTRYAPAEYRWHMSNKLHGGYDYYISDATANQYVANLNRG